MQIPFNLLQKEISGTITTQKDFLEFYSRDASSYKIKPKAIVFPKSSKDISKIIRFARRYKIPITPRGSGTGLVGGALGNGMIIDTRNLNRIKIKKNHVIVQSGVLKGNLDQALKKQNKFFPVNPSIGPYCTIGGMIANNASGSRSLKYGSMIDNVIEIEYVDSNGKIIKLPKNIKVSKKILKYAKNIEEEKFPHVSKNSSGYRLDTIYSIKDSQKLMIGSEGTLGIIISAKLVTKTIPKKRTLQVIEYQKILDAVNGVKKILNTNPVALEIVDKATLSNIKFNFAKGTKCLLFVEHDKKPIILKSKNNHTFKNNTDINRWWKYRDSALHNSLKSVPEKNRIPNIIEDGVVPISNLKEFFELVNHIERKFRCKATLYGHIGNGNIHVRLASRNVTSSKINEISREFFKRIVELGGSITAEHGDGIARAKFVETQYGKKNLHVFKQIKHEFDKQNILNPGKIFVRI